MVTIKTLQNLKAAGEKIVALTAYDASFSTILDEAGVEVILIGDSLGMVIQGVESTIPVTVDDMVYHARAVAKASKNAMIMIDMPFMSYTTSEQALNNAARLMKEGGAHVVKLEGTANQKDIVRLLVANGVPVCAHLGLRPQFVHKLGGYRVQGREQEAAEELIADALALQEAGADIILLECVPASLAKQVTETVKTPVIGIGAGVDCDGQVLVLYDMLGITPGKRPRFSKDFLAIAETPSVSQAVEDYVQAVKQSTFPGEEHSFK